MPTTTTNFALNLPTVGSDDDQWGSYLNTNFTKIDTELKTLNDSIADQDLEELGNVVNTTPAEDQVLQFNGQNWSASTLTISDISGLQTALDDKADDSDFTGITTNPADGSITYAKLNTALQVQVDRILLTDDDATPTDNQILKYSATDSEWKYADLPGSTIQTLSDVNTSALADDAVLVYNATAGEFQFESGSTLRTTLGVDISGTDNSIPVTLSGPLDYLTLSGQAITLQQVNLTTDVTDTLPVSSGGTGSATASDARTALGLQIGVNTQAFDAGLQSISGLTTAADKMLYTTAADTYAVSTLTAAGRALLDDADAAAQRTTLGLGSLATQSTITESQISDLGSYITASSTDTLTNKSGNISQWTNDAGYLTAETNDLTNVSGTLAIANGGTGSTTASDARTALGVDPAGTDNSTDVTLATVTGNYLSLSGQQITAGTVPITLGGTGSTTASDARTALGVDPAGTDNSTNVTLVTTSHDYLSLSSQAITLGPIVLTTDVSGTLPVANGGTGVTALSALNAADLGSNNGVSNATDGYVLTADGTGGVAWEAVTAGGGGSGSSYIEHSSTVSDSLAISAGTNRMYIGNTTFSGSGTMAGYLVISHGYANFTGTVDVDTTGTLNVVS